MEQQRTSSFWIADVYEMRYSITIVPVTSTHLPPILKKYNVSFRVVNIIDVIQILLSE